MTSHDPSQTDDLSTAPDADGSATGGVADGAASSAEGAGADEMQRQLDEQRDRYLRLWRDVSLLHILGISAAACVVLKLVRRRKEADRGLVSYAATLLALGLAMVASVCLMGGILPRYTLPAWELAWIALLAALGSTGDALLRGRFLRSEAGVRANA